MRRCVAAVIALSVCVLTAQAQAFHVHRVPDHDQGSGHAHPPAIHHHHAESHGDVKLVDHEESGQAITLSVPVATPVDGLVAHAVNETVLPVERPESCGRIQPVDVRSHGPPCLRIPSYRGPPSSPSA